MKKMWMWRLREFDQTNLNLKNLKIQQKNLKKKKIIMIVRRGKKVDYNLMKKIDNLDKGKKRKKGRDKSKMKRRNQMKTSNKIMDLV
jgi:hypothetical protein